MFRYDSPGEAYFAILRQIVAQGQSVPSRAGGTFEIENFSCVFEDSSHAVQPARPNFSPLLGLMEGAQLVGSLARPRLMDTLWPKYAAYTDHHGDYGDRVGYGDQIQYVVDTLIKTPDSRRAILNLWQPLQDTQPGFTDYPCTLNIGFRIREDRLNMSVTMRSNDIWRGASSDFIQFSMLHQTVAALVGIEPGKYFHNAYSLHLYESDWEAASDSIKNFEKKSHDIVITPLAKPGWTYDQTQLECRRALAASKYEQPQTDMGKTIASLQFARQRKLFSVDE
ncbi:thymidylate synthase [Gordonia phage GMA2]|uniref:thymidylate synthase n=1 Tax=Gordonia phage GMA2 TaxID=1647283 RepID=A0A0K0N6Z8_9CAUD|nr:thymidylate synthase [Gordonia phage GMA2]AKJ72610.1 hypothetical protein GMA2_72 [Gordonia phage GMA2]